MVMKVPKSAVVTMIVGKYIVDRRGRVYRLRICGRKMKSRGSPVVRIDLVLSLRRRGTVANCLCMNVILKNSDMLENESGS